MLAFVTSSWANIDVMKIPIAVPYLENTPYPYQVTKTHSSDADRHIPDTASTEATMAGL